MKNLILIIKDSYGIMPTSIKRLNSGTINRTYLIKSKKEKYIVRLYQRNTSKKQIEPEHKLIDFLHTKNFPVPKIIYTINNETLIKKNGNLFALFQFIPGKHIKNPNLIQIKNAARTLGTFHAIIRNFDLNFDKDWWYVKSIPLEKYYKQAVNLDSKHPALPFLKVQLETFRRNMPRSKIKKLPRIIIHDDFSLENLKFIGNRVVGVLDFDNVHYEIRILEFVAPLESIVGFKKFKINPQYIRSFFNEYIQTSKMPLSSLEKESLVEIFRVKHLQEALWQIRQYLCYRKAINIVALNRQIIFLRWLDKNASYFQEFLKSYEKT